MNRTTTRKLVGRACQKRIQMVGVPNTGGFTITVADIGTTSSITSVTSSNIQTALRALGGVMADCIVTNDFPDAGLRSFLVSIPSGDVGDFSTGTSTLQTASSEDVVISYVNSVASYIDPLGTITSLRADIGMFGDVIRYVASRAGQTVQSGSNLKLQADWVSSAEDDWIELWCDGTNWREKGRMIPLWASVFRTIAERGGSLAGGFGSGSRFLLRTGTPVSDSATSAAQTLFPIKPEKYPASVAGLTRKCRLFTWIISNGQAPGINFEFGLVSGSSPAGASGTVSFTASSVIAGTTVTHETLAANEMSRKESDDFDMPAAGMYAIRLRTTAANGAGADIVIGATLEWHYA